MCKPHRSRVLIQDEELDKGYKSVWTRHWNSGAMCVCEQSSTETDFSGYGRGWTGWKICSCRWDQKKTRKTPRKGPRKDPRKGILTQGHRNSKKLSNKLGLQLAPSCLLKSEQIIRSLDTWSKYKRRVLVLHCCCRLQPRMSEPQTSGLSLSPDSWSSVLDCSRTRIGLPQ